MSVFNNTHFKEHQSVHFFYKPDSGLKAIIAVHSLGSAHSAIGGARMFPYDNEDAAISDALNLSQGMSLKSAIARLPYGGAKAVIIGDPKKDKTTELLKDFADCVDSLEGTYKTSEDIGINLEDLTVLNRFSSNVVGVAERTVEPAIITSLGVFSGIKAACRYRYHNEDLTGKTVAVQGVGKVGMALCERLHKAGAKLIVSDVDTNALRQAEEDFHASTISTEEIYSSNADIFAPCAFGGTINMDTIKQLKVDIIAGSANNQLSEHAIGETLNKRGTLYAPDFVINAGGLIDVAAEIEGYEFEKISSQTEAIGDNLYEIFNCSSTTGKSTNSIAIEIATERRNLVTRSAAE